MVKQSLNNRYSWFKHGLDDSVDGKHVHDAFSERKLTRLFSNLCGMEWTRPDQTLHNVT